MAEYNDDVSEGEGDDDSSPHDHEERTTLTIRGVSISFPFIPYKCQVIYMDKVIQALQQSVNAILESPTGTGKTLCLLCATLGWRQQIAIRSNDEVVWDVQSSSTDINPPVVSVPKIVYASRTHSQLSQAIKELKTTSYCPKVAIIGSREQLCIHPDVIQKDSNSEKVHACRAKVTSKTCGYYRNVDARKIPHQQVMDIEELTKIGQTHRMCPYYLARELKSDADIIFMPYHYILDIKIRQLHGIDISNTIVILDEAHNIERICEESGSFELTTSDIGHCIKSVDHLLNELTEDSTIPLTELDDDTEKKLVYLANLKDVCLNLESALDSIELQPNTTNDVTLPGSYIFDYFGKGGISMHTFGIFLEQCDQAILALSTNTSIHHSGSYLQKLLDAVKIVFTSSCPIGMSIRDVASLHYKVYVKLEDVKTKYSNDVWSNEENTKGSNSNTSAARKLCYWCFNPGHAMCELQREGVKSIILTSGTLSPIESFSAELQLEFPIALQGSHVITHNQVWVGVVSNGCDGTSLNSSYKNRFSNKYMNSLGHTLVNFSRIIPDGMLVFFPSYSVMETTLTHWRDTAILSQIERHKQVFKEPRRKTDLKHVMEAYREQIYNTDSASAAFFAVCRGKVSEGLDFADCNGRAVIITGLPYPPREDPKVKLKMGYLRDMKVHTGGSKFIINDSDWYNQQASRAVNQAIGRVIRHKSDYGAIILCDERFNYARNTSDISKWLRPHVKRFDKFGQAQKDILTFFKLAETLYGKSKTSIAPPTPANDHYHNNNNNPLIILMEGYRDNSKDHHNVTDTTYPTASLARVKELISSEEVKTDLLSSLNYSESHSMKCHHNTLSKPSTINQQVIIERTKEEKPNVKESKTTSKSIDVTHKTNKAIDLVQKVKEYFCEKSFEEFKSAIKSYRETENIDSFLDSLSNLFKHPSSFQIFEDMHKFVRPHHFDQYYKVYLISTGKSHPFQNQSLKRNSNHEIKEQPSLKIQKFSL